MPNGNISNDALDSLIDPKGNVVLQQFGNTALLLRPESTRNQQENGFGDPYVVAYGYDKSNGEWSRGSYHSDPAKAYFEANPEILEDACITWKRSDVSRALEYEGFEANDWNINHIANSAILSGFYDSLSETGNELFESTVMLEANHLDRSDPEKAVAAMAQRTMDMKATKAWDGDILQGFEKLEEDFYSPKDGLYFSPVCDVETGSFEAIAAYCISAPRLLDEVDFPNMLVGEVDALLSMQPVVFPIGSEGFDQIVDSLAKDDEGTIELSPYDEAYKTLTAALGKLACWDDFPGCDDERIKKAASEYARNGEGKDSALSNKDLPVKDAVPKSLAETTRELASGEVASDRITSAPADANRNQR